MHAFPPASRIASSSCPTRRFMCSAIPFVNRLVLWWRHMQDERFLTRASREQRNALKRDLEPVVRIYHQL